MLTSWGKERQDNCLFLFLFLTPAGCTIKKPRQPQSTPLNNISHYHPGMLGIIWISWIPRLPLFPNLQMVQVNLSGSRNSVAMSKLLVWTSGAQPLSDVIWVPCVAAEMGREDLKYELIPSDPLRLERQRADKEIQSVPMGLIRTYPKETFF